MTVKETDRSPHSRHLTVVEGLNVVNGPKCNKVLKINVITFCPKCNKVLNVITIYPTCNKLLRLRVVPHFSSGVVERAKRAPFLAWGDFHARSLFARSTIPEEKMGDYS